MLAIIYLALMFFLGDAICRRFYPLVSTLHRIAAAFFVGLLVSSWFTYLAALLLARASHPLLWGNLIFFAGAIPLVVWLRRRKPAGTDTDRAPGSDRWDWVFAGAYLVFACWLMFASLNSSGGKLRIANNEWSDFGPSTAIMQSFAVGHNFPTQYPHFSGDRIRYHFLFAFQAGNLEFLGLDPAWSLNLLSICSLVAMLLLVMVLGEVLFESRAVARLGSALFFFFGSLSYIPFLHRQGSVRAALSSVAGLRDFLPSVFPYRGELWGVWSQVVFLNQRHLASAIGVLLLILIFLVLRYRTVPPTARAGLAESEEIPVTPFADPVLAEEEFANTAAADVLDTEGAELPSESITEPAPDDTTPSWEVIAEPAAESPAPPIADPDRTSAWGLIAPGFIVSGVLLGLLPLWNSAVFLAAITLLGGLLILLPLRRQMLLLALTAGIFALPQVIYLRGGNAQPAGYSLFHWGYTLDSPTFWHVVKYLSFTFGFKWLLVAVALVFATRLQRRIFVAALGLIALAFCFQLSEEVLANHKFLHLWLIIINLFVASGLWLLWQRPLFASKLAGRVAAVVLFILVTLGGFIDLFPIHNAYWVEVAYRNDPLVSWVLKETSPKAIFLTERFVNHPILMAGRRVFYGWPYYAWSAGYRAGERDAVYRRLFEEKDPQALLRLLHENNISYVAINDELRQGEFGAKLNEAVYRANFTKAFQDTDYGALAIYRVPEGGIAASPARAPKTTAAPAVTMFVGGKGKGEGQFDWPRGLAVDGAGNILVADTNNGRIEKFSSAGVFVRFIGGPGKGPGEFREPNGIAIDKNGNIYVVDVLNQRIQKFKPDGTFVAAWQGSEPGFYGPRDLAVAPDGSVYIVDQGRARVVKLDADGKELRVWGTRGAGDGEFDEHTAIAFDEKTRRVFVADPRNQRIQIFDPDGKYLAKWIVPEWQQQSAWALQDLVIDPKAGRLYATGTATDEVLVFDLETGAKLESLKPTPPDRLEGASALGLSGGKLYVLNTYAARVSQIALNTKK